MSEARLRLARDGVLRVLSRRPGNREVLPAGTIGTNI